MTGGPFLHIQSMFTRIVFRSKQASKLIIERYSDVIQTLVITGNKYYLSVISTQIKFHYKIEASGFVEAWLTIGFAAAFGLFPE